MPSDKELEIADKIEEVAQKILSKIQHLHFLKDRAYISWKTTIIISLYSVLAISIVSMFDKSDFVNVFCALVTNFLVRWNRIYDLYFL